MAKGDLELVYSSWIRSFRDSHYAGPYPIQIYYDAIRNSIDLYRTRPGFRLMVAVNKCDHDQIYGWLAYEHISDTQVIYYAYVKELFRRKGVLRGLLRSAYIEPARPIVYISRTRCASELLRHMAWPAKHNPNIVRKTYRHEEAPTNDED
jgi:hypothetical protein